MKAWNVFRAVGVIFALSFAVLACGGDSETASTATQPAGGTAGTASTVKVELGEDGSKYFIRLDKSSVPAGETTFVIDNIGTMHHEFAVFKTDLPADDLPLNDEGKVDEDKAEMIGEAVYARPIRGDEDHRIRDGRGVDYTMTLQPGKYVLICNLAGHYKAGQYVEFTVVGEPVATPEPTTKPGPDGSDAVVGTPVKVQLGEKGAKYFVTTDKNSVPSGETTFVIDNVGSMHHEFAIFKTDLPANKLPLNDEGKVDEEKAGMIAEAVYTKPLRGDEDHRIRDGRGVNFTITLAPGKYVLLCNLAGHYAAGQYTSFTVT